MLWCPFNFLPTPRLDVNLLTVPSLDLSGRYEVKSEWEHRAGAGGTGERHLVAGVAGTESCYLKQSVMYNNTDWTASKVADTRVMLQYLSDRMYDEVGL